MFCRNKLGAALLAASLAACAPAAAGPQAAPLITPFSLAAPGDALPGRWMRVDIRGVDRPTAYTLEDDGGTTVLQAHARASASAVVNRLQMPLAGEWSIRWRWKVSHLLKRRNPATKEGDDYAARLYVMFDYPLERLPFGDRMRLRIARALQDGDVPAAALCYVWDPRLPAGAIFPSPYTSRVRMVVVDGAPGGQWHTVERDLAADFRRAFGEEPAPVSAVAVATDTDNTGDAVTAWFGDIVLKKRGVSAAGP